MIGNFLTGIYRLQTALIIAFFFIYLPPAGAYHGLTSLAPIGGIVAPFALHDSIRMDSLEVTIRLMKTRYEVDAVFHFVNSGRLTKELIGIPTSAYKGSKFRRFDMWVGGRKLKTEEQFARIGKQKSFPLRSSQIPCWRAGSVTFLGNDRTAIRVSYEADYRPVRRKLPRREVPPHFRKKEPYRMAGYVYGTGSYWKGSIRNTSFTIEGAEIGGKEAFQIIAQPLGHTPKWSYTSTKDTVRLVTKDFKPEPGDWLKIYLLR